MVPIDFYTDQYKEMYEDVVLACDCVSRCSCSKLSSEISDVKTMLSKLTLKDNWQDQLGASFSTVMQSCTSTLESIISSINSSFKSSEEYYKLLKTYLEDFKDYDEKYRAEIRLEPHLYTNVYKESTGRLDESGNPIFSYNRTNYELDHRKWADNVHHLQVNCQTIKTTIDQTKGLLDAINGSSPSGGTLGTFAGFDIPKMFTVKGVIPTDTQRDWILAGYTSEDDPREIIYSQGKFDDVGIDPNNKSKTLKTSGCGMISAAVCISCALSRAYGQNIAIDPRQNVQIFKDNGYKIQDYFDSNHDFNWTSAKDTTAIYKDISVIRVEPTNGKCFNDETMQNVLEAGGSAQVSLLGRGHVVPVTEYCGDDKYYVAESSNPDTKIVAIDGPVYSYSKASHGTIQGKNQAYVYMANKDLDIDYASGEINGLEAKGLNVSSISIGGNTYDAHVKGDHIVIDDVASLNSDLAELES